MGGGDRPQGGGGGRPRGARPWYPETTRRRRCPASPSSGLGKGGGAHTSPSPPPWGAAAAGGRPWAPHGTATVCREARKPGRTGISRGCISQRLDASRRGQWGRPRGRGAPLMEAAGPGRLEDSWPEAGVLRGRFRGVSGFLCSVLSWQCGQKLENLSVINHGRPRGPVCRLDSA